jgi:hypothetical protein
MASDDKPDLKDIQDRMERAIEKLTDVPLGTPTGREQTFKPQPYQEEAMKQLRSGKAPTVLIIIMDVGSDAEGIFGNTVTGNFSQRFSAGPQRMSEFIVQKARSIGLSEQLARLKIEQGKWPIPKASDFTYSPGSAEAKRQEAQERAKRLQGPKRGRWS